MHSTAHRPQVQANDRPSSNSAGTYTDLSCRPSTGTDRVHVLQCGSLILHSTEVSRPASDHTSLHDGHFFCEDQLVRRKPVAAEFICGQWPVVNSDRVQLAPNHSADFGISDKSSNADKQFPLRGPSFDHVVKQRSAISSFRLLAETAPIPIEGAVAGVHHIRDLLQSCGERTRIALIVHLD